MCQVCKISCRLIGSFLTDSCCCNVFRGYIGCHITFGRDEGEEENERWAGERNIFTLDCRCLLRMRLKVAPKRMRMNVEVCGPSIQKAKD